MTSLGTLDLNFLTLRRLFPYRNGTTDICANTILLQNERGEVEWINPANVFADVSGTLVAKGNCDSDYLYWNQSSQLWLPGGKRIRMGCDAGAIQTDLSAVTVAIGYNAGYTSQDSTSIAIGQYAGNSMQGLGGVAMGSYAGSVGQRADGVAIGTDAGRTTQGGGSIAIGGSAGGVRQDASAVAIGFNAGLNTQGRGAVAMGAYAGFMDQSGSAVAIGMYAGSNKQGINTVAVGARAGLLCQTDNAVAVGKSAGSGNQGANAIAIGESAGTTSQGQGAIALGSLAGSSVQSEDAIAIGSNAGRITQGVGSVAIGALAGSNVQREGAIAIGFNAGYDRQNLNAVAIGLGAGYSTQNSGAIAIGSNAGYSTQGAGAVAIGMAAGLSSQGANAVAIGSNAGFGLQKVGAVAIGAGAGYSTQGAGAVAIGSNAGYSTQGVGAVALGMTAGWSSQGVNAIAIGSNAGVSTQGTHAIAMGFNAGAVDQSANAVAIGLSAGFSSQGTSAVAIGWRAGSNVQGIGAIAVGEGAGLIRQDTNAVAIGLGAGLSTQNANAIAIGSNAGYSTQGASAIAFGQAAGISSQGTNAIAIGSNAGAIVQGIGAVAMGARAGWSTQGAGAVAIGSNAGTMDQSANAIAIGLSAGWSSQGICAVAIGSNAGYSSQGEYAVAIGASAGISAQGIHAIAIGSNAGAVGQGRGGIAIGAIPISHIQSEGAIVIGSNAITVGQSANAIAIGNNVCGANTQGANSIAIGYNALSGAQDSSSIVLNATGVGLSATDSTLYLDPVLNNSTGTDTTRLLQYVPGDKKVVYNDNITINLASGTINASGDILPTADIRYSLGSSALAFKHLYVSSIISDTSNVAVSGDIIPYADNVYSVGLSTMRWKDVFVGPGSIYIGGATNATRAILSASGDALLINSANTGDVGIATNSPNAKLHVQGTTLLNGTATAGGNIVPESTNSRDLGTSVTRWRALYTHSVDASGHILPTVDNTYNLGSATKRWNDVFVGPGSVYIGEDSDSSQVILEASDNSLIINKRNGGNVGIGVANPAARLDVSGTSRFTGTMSLSGDIIPLTEDAHDLGSSTRRWDNIYTNYIDVSAGFTFTGNLNPSADNTYSLGINTTRWKDLYVGTGAVYIGGTLDASRAILDSCDNALIINATNDGRVGIGTTNPILELDVSGSVNAKDMYIRADDTTKQNALYFSVGSTRIFALYRKDNTNDLRFYNYAGGNFDMMALKSNGNVGIGIGNTNPATTLDVSGTGITVTSSGPVISIASTNPGDMLVRNYGTSDRYGIGQYIDGNMRLFASGTVNYAKIHMSKPTNSLQTGAGATFTDVMTVDVFNSRVGIGTTNPATTLDVSGTGITVTSSGPVISIASTNPGDMLVRNYGTSDRYGIGQYIDGNMRLFASGTVNYAKIHLSKPTNSAQTGAGATFTDVMTVDVFNSRVGIGTTDPGAKLDVVGSIRANGGVVYGEFDSQYNPQIIARGTGTNQNKYTYMGYNTTDQYGYIGAVESGGAERNLILQPYGANVGIGTINPFFSLDVSGVAQVKNMYIRSHTAGVENGLYFYAGTAIGPAYGIYRPASTTDLRFYNFATTSDQLTLKPSGNTGIGTDNPGYTLDVNGDVNIRSGFVYRINTNTVLTATNYIFAAGSINYSGGAASLASGYNVSGVSITAGGQITITFSNNYSSGSASDAKNYPMTCSPTGNFVFVYPVTKLNGSVLVYIVDGAGGGREQSFNFIIIKTGTT